MKLSIMKTVMTLIITAALLASQPINASTISNSSESSVLAVKDAAVFCADDTPEESDAALNTCADDISEESDLTQDTYMPTGEIEVSSFDETGGETEDGSLDPYENNDGPTGNETTRTDSGETMPEESNNNTESEQSVVYEPEAEIPSPDSNYSDSITPEPEEDIENEPIAEEIASAGSGDSLTVSGDDDEQKEEESADKGDFEDPVEMNTSADASETDAAYSVSESENPVEMYTSAAASETDAEEPLNALSFQSDALIQLFNAKMNVTDASFLKRYTAMGGSSLEKITQKLSGQTAVNVDNILRSYFAFTALNLKGADPDLTYPDGIIDQWAAYKKSILDENITATEVLPWVNVLDVTINGTAIAVETEEVYLIKASGTSEQTLQYSFHNVFTFSDENDTVILTDVHEYSSYHSSNGEAPSMDSMASSTWTGGAFGVAANEMVENAIQWGLAIAADQSHGYSQAHRWGPDYDCSSFVISCFGQAGFDLGYYNWPNDTNHEQDLYYTGNLKEPFKAAGFEWITAEDLGGMDSYKNLKRGDIVLREYHHTEIYLGNGYLLGAHGQVATAAHPNRSSKTGDQGDELGVLKYTNYYGKGYDGVLRMTGSNSSSSASDAKYSTGEYTITDTLNVRSGPDTTYSIANVLRKGDVVNVREVSGNWGKIGDKQWISLLYASLNYSTTLVDIAEVKVTGLNKSYNYVNKAIKPSIKLTYEGSTLKKGVDYTIQYQCNKAARTNGKIILTGIGDKFNGTRTLTFKIVPRVGTYRTTEEIILRKSASASAAQYIKIPSGAFIYVTSVKNSGIRYWGKTSYGGKTGWFMFGAANYLSSMNIADGIVTNGKINTSYTYMLVSASNPEYSLSAPLMKTASYLRYYKVKRSSEKQRFTFKTSKAGGYNLISCYTEQAVTPHKNKKTSGTKMSLNSASNSAIKSWKVQSNSDGTFSFINVSTKLALRSAGGTTQYKGYLELVQNSSKDASQKFYLVRMPDVDNSYDGLYYIMKGKTKASYCFTVKSKSKVTGASLILYKKTNAVNKKFRLVYSGDGYYRILASDTGFAVTLKNNSTDRLTPLVMEEWKGYKSQRWKVVANSDGTVCFVNVNGYAITLSGNKVANNTVIRSNYLKKTKYDKWVLKKA